MRLRVLGCSGGVGLGCETTALLLDDDILIDCGTGVGRLSLAEMKPIRHLFLTHSHLDHCALLPMLLDNKFGHLSEAFKVYGLPATLDALRQHLFNDLIWPDFTRLPNPENPVVVLQPVSPGQLLELDGRKLEVIEVNHTVDAAAYRLESGGHSLVFSGDTATNDNLWAALNRADPVDVLIVEAAFANRDRVTARLAHHYCSETLVADLQKLKIRPQVFITHLKPGSEAEIMAELTDALPGWALHSLEADMVFSLPAAAGSERL
ncbi:MAG: 3',5'-cyclic-nucleotide phosphodiesterase [Gammaproteobacteria bacterium]|nr:3',5'-cyclic-nucleotide phosphodiesterase [Gammaproteobacteria bacterium]